MQDLSDVTPESEKRHMLMDRQLHSESLQLRSELPVSNDHQLRAQARSSDAGERMQERPMIFFDSQPGHGADDHPALREAARPPEGSVRRRPEGLNVDAVMNNAHLVRLDRVGGQQASPGVIGDGDHDVVQGPDKGRASLPLPPM